MPHCLIKSLRRYNRTNKHKEGIYGIIYCETKNVFIDLTSFYPYIVLDKVVLIEYRMTIKSL